MHVIEPETQCSVPGVHSPVPSPHEAPPPGSPSSAVPSQSLSRPSHTSGAGGVSPRQIMDAPTHWIVPSAHSPTLDPQGVPVPGTALSAVPSQSLSSPSHVSVVGPTAPVQDGTPPVHSTVPSAHSPTLEPQGTPMPGMDPSSAVPSQSLSRPSHTSAVGPM